MLHLLLYLTAVLSLSTCDSMELCQGDTKCTLCTVTGPTVIDIHGQVNSAQDRCAYSLMSSASIPDFQVHATFQERRRKDVSFLDRVILSVNSSVHINLEQGGIVQLGSVPMQLNATAQIVHGVELSRDQTGVTAKKSHLNYTMTVFFDGYTAQIHIKGPSGQAVEGLCGNSSRSFSEARLSVNNETGCETPYEDTANSTINCNKTTERCNLLKEAPFTACQSNVDPEPYVTACTNTLCKYPATDGLNCQFLEAYARACSLHSNDTLDGWRSKANCSAEAQAFCQDRFCSAHEFCGEDSGGKGTRCHCRAIFASAYESQNALGDVVVCNKTSRSVTLAGCLLEDEGISYSDLHLYDNTCRGQMDNVTHMMTLGFDSKTNPCETMIKMNNNSEVITKNGVMLESTGEEMMDFTCPFILPDINFEFSVNIKVKSGISNTSVAYVTSGVWNYTVTMEAFADAGRTQTVRPETLLHLNQEVWIELKTHGLDQTTVALVTNACYATNEPSPDSNLTYNIITKGCANPADQTVKMEGNGEGTSNFFSFNLFQFSGKTKDVYLHCKLHLCDKQIDSCAPNCSQIARRRRSTASKYEEQNPATVFMAWGT